MRTETNKRIKPGDRIVILPGPLYGIAVSMTNKWYITRTAIRIKDHKMILYAKDVRKMRKYVGWRFYKMYN